jgi:hypothetical protein
MTSPRNLISVEVTLGSNGVPLQVFRREDGKAFVAGTAGASYTFTVRNLTGNRIKVAASVDGRSVLDDAEANWHTNTGMVINAWQRYVFRGWRVDDDTTREFIFGDPEGSVAAQATGTDANVGVIGLAAFQERLPYRPRLQRSGTPYYYGAATRGSGQSMSAPIATTAKADFDTTGLAGDLGTGIGTYQADAVRRTTFSTDEGSPDVLAVGYASYATLKAAGIIREQPLGDPDPFPGNREHRHLWLSEREKTGYERY